MKYSNAPRHFASRARTHITNRNRPGGRASRLGTGPAILNHKSARMIDTSSSILQVLAGLVGARRRDARIISKKAAAGA